MYHENYVIKITLNAICSLNDKYFMTIFRAKKSKWSIRLSRRKLLISARFEKAAQVNSWGGREKWMILAIIALLETYNTPLQIRRDWKITENPIPVFPVFHHHASLNLPASYFQQHKWLLLIVHFCVSLHVQRAKWSTGLEMTGGAFLIQGWSD